MISGTQRHPIVNAIPVLHASLQRGSAGPYLQRLPWDPLQVAADAAELTMVKNSVQRDMSCSASSLVSENFAVTRLEDEECQAGERLALHPLTFF